MVSDDVDSWKRRATPGGAMGPLLAVSRSAARRIDSLETRAPLESAAISKGGLRIRDGGSLTVMDGGEVQVLGVGGERIRFWAGRLFLRYGSDDYEGRISAGLATDGATPALWLIPPRGDSSGDDNENAVIIAGKAGSSPGALFLGTRGRLQGTAGTDVYLSGATGASIQGGSGAVTISSSNQVSINSGAGQQMLLRPGGTLYLKANGTTTVAANTYISGSGADVTLYQVSSSRRYKDSIADHHSDQAALLAARPVSWRDKAEVETDPDTTARYVGFIAEELHDLGLTEYVTYNPDGSPESVAYDRLTVGLLDLVKTQAQQIAWLSQQVAALTGQSMPDFTPEPTAPITATRPAPAPAPAPDPEPDPIPDTTQEDDA